jgi:ribonuclease J
MTLRRVSYRTSLDWCRVEKRLKILPLGGLGEIGMNCLVVEYGDDLVLIDCGVQFPDSSYVGVDLLVPDLSYVRARLNKLRGVIVTHGHDDHIGAIPYLLKDTSLDIYATPFPKGLIENKMAEVPDTKEIRFHEISPRVKFKVGCFEFDPIPVQHSIIEALAFAIKTPIGTLVHSGDFKHDPRETSRGVITFEPFEQIGKEGVLLLLSDSTNAERAGHTLSETDIAQSFDQILSAQTGRMIIALFASNIRRIENLMGLAHKQGKKVALVGRSMHSYTRLAHMLESLNIPADTLILLEDIQRYRDDQIIVLATGSQAEPQSALVRIAQGINKDFQIRAGDRVILSSRFIPGNERAIAQMIDNLYRSGAEVMYESVQQIHVSGHGFQEELLMMLNATKPKYFVPIHGHYRHLAKHAKLAKEAGVLPENVFVIENGQALEVTEKGLQLAERLELQRTAVFEMSFMQGSPTLFTQRLALAKTGIVFTAILRDKKTKKIVGVPSVRSYGIMYRQGEHDENVQNEAQSRLVEVYQDSSAEKDLEDTIRLEMRRFYKKKASHKPVVIPVILDI